MTIRVSRDIYMSRERFLDRFRHFTGEPHQIEGVSQLWGLMDLACPGLLNEEAKWARTFSTPAQAPRQPLVRPYCSQQDNGREGWRQCQTSSIAMELIGTKAKGILDDLDYLAIVNKYGDTTLQTSHQKALNQLGIKHQFSTQWENTNAIKAAIDSGRGFIAGVLHHGPITTPKGGGHYVLIYGYTKTHWLVHDPFGELDLIRGGWSNQAPGSGKAQNYSFNNFNPRWDCGGQQWGWVLN